jgi:hypothetical protein
LFVTYVIPKADRKLPAIIKYILAVFATSSCLIATSQVLMDDLLPSSKTNFCDSIKSKKLIGTYAKIWDNGGIYLDANRSNYLHFPTNEMKDKGGKNGWGEFYPQTGEVGEIVYVSNWDNQMSASGKIIYILKINDFYVPIGCGYLTDTNKIDNKQEWEKYYREEVIREKEYAAGCEFKTNGINNCWNRAGICKIDIISETFACNLKDKGIDTIMLCKYIYDDGSSPSEKAFVLWQKDGKGHLKTFFNNSQHTPTENKEKEFDWGNIYKNYYANKIDTITSDPQPSHRITHSMGYSVQFYSPQTKYFCERLQDNYWKTDKTHHPKAKFWKLIYNKFDRIKEES